MQIGIRRLQATPGTRNRENPEPDIDPIMGLQTSFCPERVLFRTG